MCTVVFAIKIILYLLLFAIVHTVEICGTNYTTPREGFNRKNCIPEHYEGSCLSLFSKPATFKNAYVKCHVDYGGRLATADSEAVFSKWIKRIYRDYNFQVKEETKFWVGYGKNSFYESTPAGKLIRPFYDMVYWNKAFRGRDIEIDLPWEEGANLGLLENNTCSSHATVFNPNNAKFNVKSADEEFPFLCEIPRYPKFKCSSKWHLIPESRMCVLVGDYQHNMTFFEAAATCQEKGAFPVVVAKIRDLTRLNAITALHGMGTPNDFLWSGIKQTEGAPYSLDGTPHIMENDSSNSKCTVIFGEKQRHESKKGYYGAQPELCNKKFPYLCQRFVDQAFALNIE